MANYRTELVNGQVQIDEAILIQDNRAFQQNVEREADLYGWTGSLGVMVHGGRFLRLGGTVDFPTKIRYDGISYGRLEDWEKIDETEFLFRDDITLPLSLRGGTSLRWAGLTVAADVRWTDYAQIDYEGEILASPRDNSFLREPAYRAVVEYHVRDAYATEWGEARGEFCTIWSDGIPWFAYDGLFDAWPISTYVSKFLTRRDVPTSVTMDVFVTPVSDDVRRITTDVCLESGADPLDVRLYAVAVEDPAGTRSAQLVFKVTK